VTATPPPSSGLQVREAERSDLPAIHRIEQSAFPQPWPAAAFERYIGQPGFLVADDGGVVGYIVADIVEGHGRLVGHIKDLAVRSDHRREGVGSGLLSHALSVLEDHAATAKLEVRTGNEGAIDLYRRHGFTYRRRLPSYYANGEDALVFVQSL
jgi:ribosomal-protein-alanine N-acetyltransferase